MKFLNEFAMMKSEFKVAEKDNKLRKQQHNRRFEQLQKESEAQTKRVSQRLQYLRNR